MMNNFKNLKVKTANILAVVITKLCFLFLFLLMIVEVPASNKDLVNFLSGILFGTGFGGVIYFLYNFKKDKGETGELFEENLIKEPEPTICEVCNKDAQLK